MTTRIHQALEDLSRRGYKFNSLKQLSGGINSSVFRATSNHKDNYVIKVYPLPTDTDARDRCRAETDFLKYVQSCGIYKIPRLLEKSISAGWTLMSWIDGYRPKNLHKSNLEEITNFISGINQTSNALARAHLEPASEACQSLQGMIKSIAERIERLKTTAANSEPNQQAIHWIVNTIEPHFKSTSQKLLDRRANCSHWQDLHDCRIASPSDVGIHNTLQNQQGLHFLDFEYAGLDDLSKLAADWILQPEHCLNQKQEVMFTERLQKCMEERIGSSWHTRLDDIKPLIHVKWCLIMLKELSSNTLSQHQLKKAMNYFASHQ